MKILVNALKIGRTPRKDATYFNVYGYVFRDAVYVEFLDYKTNVYIEPLFEKRVEKLSGYSYDDVYKYGFLIHLFYDKSKKSVWLDKEEHDHEIETDPNFRQRFESALQAIDSLLKSPANEPYFGKFEGSLNTAINEEYITKTRYQVYNIYDFPYMYSMLTLNPADPKKSRNLGAFNNIQIVSFRFFDRNGMYDPEIMGKIVSPQIGASFMADSDLNERVSSGDQKVVLVEKPPTKEFMNFFGKEIKFPFLMINNAGLNEFTIQEEIYDFVASKLNFSSTQIQDYKLKNMIRYGYDLQDIFYFNLRNPESSAKVSESIDEDASKTTQQIKNQVAQWVKDFEVTDVATEDFLKTLFMYVHIFPFTTEKIKNGKKETSPSGYYNKQYYSVISIPNTGFDQDSAPSDPATKNHKLFAHVFSIHGDPVVTKNKAYYLIYSPILFPENIYRLFIQDASSESCSLHEVFEYNQENKYLTKYSLVNNPPQESAELIEYNNNVMPEFSRNIQNTEGIDIKHDFSDKRLIARTLVDFPYAYNHVLQMFDKEGVEFKNINIIMIYDMAQRSMLGGYMFVNKTSNTEESQEAVMLANGNDMIEFQAPIIIINLANPRVQMREEVSYVLIHECRHYLDDLMIQQGKQEDIISNVPQVTVQSDDPQYYRQYEAYTRSTAESRAFSQTALALLNHYSPDYVIENWDHLKSWLLSDTYHSRDYGTDSSFSEIADAALKEFLEQHGRSEEVPV
jgi:hypothetical protein